MSQSEVEQPHETCAAVMTAELAQSWRRTRQEAFRPGRVKLSWNPNCLLVEAELHDDAIFNHAKQDNERLWQTGDSFEIFLQRKGADEYVELHVAPNNKRLHLRLPNRAPGGGQATNAASFDSLLVSPVGFRSSVRLFPSAWKVLARIPPDVLGLERFRAGRQLLVNFARYDATPGREPVLSASATHPVANFHRREDWTTVRLKERNPPPRTPAPEDRPPHFNTIKSVH